MPRAADNTPNSLSELIIRHGHSLSKDSKRLRNYLNDIGKTTKRERAILVYAADLTIPEQLISQLQSLHLSFTISRLAGQLHQQHGYELKLAEWAVKAWSDALAKAAPRGSQHQIRCPSCAQRFQFLGMIIGSVVPCPHCNAAIRIYNEGQAAGVEPQSAGTGQVLRVGSGSNSTFGTLAEALEKCEAGTKLVLSPGVYVYKEAVVVRKDVSIIGEGGPAMVRLEVSEAPCIEHSSGELLMESLSLAVTTPNAGRRAPAISCTGGNLAIKDCEISSSHKECIFLSGSTASVKASNCRFMSPKAQAIYAASGSKLELHECQIHQTGSSGLVVENSTAVVRNSTITETQLRAVLARNAKLHLSGVTISSIAGNGLELVGTDFDILDCTISECRGRGILARGACTGAIRGLHTANNRAAEFFDETCHVTQQ